MNGGYFGGCECGVLVMAEFDGLLAYRYRFSMRSESMGGNVLMMEKCRLLEWVHWVCSRRHMCIFGYDALLSLCVCSIQPTSFADDLQMCRLPGSVTTSLG